MSSFRSRAAPRTRSGKRPVEKIRWLLRLEEGVIYNRLDRPACDLPSAPAVKFKLPLARARAKNYGAEKARLSVTAAAFPSHSFFKLVRKPWAAKTHGPVNFRGSEAA